MVYLLVFLSGSVLMSLELLGSRILAPFFGNSIYVWGSLIGIFLAALSLGYFLGGLAADRFPLLEALGWPLLLAGLLTSFVPAFSASLGPSLLEMGLEPRSGSLLLSLLLFFLPSVLMGMVSPLAIRLQTSRLTALGSSAGTLYALSTVGSILGTFLTAFYLIPAWGVADLTRSLGFLLVLLSGAAFLARRKWHSLTLSLVLLLFLSVVWQPWAARNSNVTKSDLPVGWKTLYQADSLYHHIRVVESQDSRYLRFDNSWQSGMYLTDPYATRFEYTDFFHLALVINPKIEEVLFIGLGGGSAPKKFLKDYPQMKIDVAELDPAVVQVARRYFFLPDDSSRFHVRAQDGRVFLQNSSRQYDLIVLDAYYADSIPFHLTTQEFLSELKAHLKPGGLVAANLIGALQGNGSGVFRALYRTFAAVFPTRYLFPVLWEKNNDPASLRNIILVAGEGQPLVREVFIRKAADMAKGGQIKVPRLADYAASLYQKPLEVEDVPLLTDDHAPVDNLLPFEPKPPR
ncbi:MAG: fused MFS/spermidine synthase [Firmicutes bacterium]|nr:fused MFS/spermidine synthase [Bacillota bacterium]